MSRYAADTSVSAEKSRAEIEQILVRYGADQFAYATSRTEAQIGFVAHGRQVRFRLAMPDPNAREFTHTPNRNTERSASAAYNAWEQATRQRWRALALVIKAKLEAVEAGITEFEDEFLAHIALPNGSTFGDWARPELARVYDSGDMPALMPGAPS